MSYALLDEMLHGHRVKEAVYPDWTRVHESTKEGDFSFDSVEDILLAVERVVLHVDVHVRAGRRSRVPAFSVLF